MQKMTQSFTFLLLLSIIMLISCNQDNDCDGTFSIKSISPNKNLPGKEVKIEGTGFSQNTEVRFAGQLAKSTFTNENFLTAIVPNNVNGFLDLTVENGDCLARTDFEVLGTLPANLAVASPVVIVLPTIPVAFPPNISNQWINYYDNAHKFQLTANSCNGITEQQILELTAETHDTNEFLNDNPITGVYRCSSRVYVEIDRTKKGGSIEKLNGYIINASTIGESNSDGNTYMLFNSLVTGKQYVFFTKG
ncbi:MAG: IPT/TIG domain-containing protein [Saprospiraceae bacterium]